MKESLTSIDNSLIFRETFESEVSVRNNGGIPTNVTFKNGMASTIGTGSQIVYAFIKNKILPTNVTFRVIAKPDRLSNICGLFDIGTGGLSDGVGINVTSPLTTFIATMDINQGSGAKYSVDSGLFPISKFYDLIITITNLGISFYIDGTFKGANQTSVNIIKCASELYLGKTFSDGDVNGLWTFDLFEIYNRTLSASEVRNLYNNKTHVTLPKVINSTKKLILDVNAYSGIIKNYGIGATTLTNNGVLVENDGGRNIMRFPTNSYLDLGNYHSLIGDITICGIVKIQAKGITQRILYNTQLYISYVSSLIGIANSNAATMLSSSMEVGTYAFVCITRSSSGIINIYIGNKSTFGLNGSANQVGTTPAAGTNINIGGAGTLSTLKDKLSSLKIYEGILSLDEITQEYTSNKSKL